MKLFAVDAHILNPGVVNIWRRDVVAMTRSVFEGVARALVELEVEFQSVGGGVAQIHVVDNLILCACLVPEAKLAHHGVAQVISVLDVGREAAH